MALSTATACGGWDDRMLRTQPPMCSPLRGVASTRCPTGERSRAWLFGVAYRVVGNQYRSRRRRSRLWTRLADLGTGHDPSRIEPSSGREVEFVHLALDQLSPADRELLRLSSWDGLTRSEIALCSASTRTPWISDCIVPDRG